MTPQPRWNEVLRALREVRGITQDGWAARLGYSRRTLQRWEQGDAVPDGVAEATLLALCQELELFRHYDRGPLQGVALTPAWLQHLLAEARLPSAVPDRGPVPRAAAPSTNLPAPLTSFIGR